MSEFEYHTVSIDCPHCKAPNMIVGSVEDFEEVACSKCNKQIGIWSELVAATNQTTEESHQARPAGDKSTT
jgi:transposase-like protein